MRKGVILSIIPLLIIILGTGFSDAFAEVSPPIEKYFQVGELPEAHLEILSDGGFIISQNQLIKISNDGSKNPITITRPDSPNQFYLGDFTLDSDENIYLIAKKRIDGADYPFVVKYSTTGMKLFEFELKNENGLQMNQYNFRKILVDEKYDIFILMSDRAEILVYNEVGIFKKKIALSEMRSNVTGMAVDNIGNIFFSGQDKSTGEQGIWKLSPNGIYTKLNSFNAKDIIIDSNGNLYAVPPANSIDYIASKFDPNGNLLFQFDESKIEKTNYPRIIKIDISSNGKPYVLVKDFVVKYYNKFVEDTTPPTIQTVSDIVKEATSTNGQSISFSTSATDAIDGSMPVSCTPNSGKTFPLGKTQVTCTSTDLSSNTSFIKFNVIIQDTTPPIISSVEDIELKTITDETKVGFTVPTATDISGVSSISCDISPNSLFPIGETPVTCTATDNYDNTATTTFTVNMIKVEVPNDGPFTLPCSMQEKGDGVSTSSCNGTYANGKAIANVGINYNSGNFPIKNYQAIGYFIDQDGVQSQNITVSFDKISPGESKTLTFTNPSAGYVSEFKLQMMGGTLSTTNYDDLSDLLPTRDDIGYEWKYPTNRPVYDELASRNYEAIDFTGYEDDIWRGHIKGSSFDTNFFDLYIYQFNSKSNANDFYDSHVDYWKNRGGFSQWTPSSSDGECFGRVSGGSLTDKISLYCNYDRITIFATVTGFDFEMKDMLTDTENAIISNYKSYGGIDVQIESQPTVNEQNSDTIAPTIFIPSNILKTTDTNNPVSIAFTVTASDNTDGVITPSCNPSSGYSFPVGTTNVKCTATDSSGNTSTKSFSVTVNYEAPQIVETNDEITITPVTGSGAPGCEDTANGCYTPSTARISVGGKVIMKNTDTAAHTFTSGTPSEGPDGFFDTSLLMVGGSYEWTPTSDGTYPYLCMVHPWMIGEIIVGEGGPRTLPDKVTVSTDNTVYSSDEEMTIIGKVSPYDGTRLKIIINDPYGNLLYSERVTPETDGSFTEKLILDDEFQYVGKYTVIAIYKSVTTQSQFQIKSDSTYVSEPKEFSDNVKVTTGLGSGAPGCEDSDSCYLPYKALVKRMGTVTWINEDSAAHTITSGTPDGGPDGRFDSSLLMVNGEFSKTFTSSGVYPYFCMVHPWSIGLVIVGEETAIPEKPIVTKNIDLNLSLPNRILDINTVASLQVSISGNTDSKNVAINIIDPTGSTKISRTLDIGPDDTEFLDFRIGENFRPGTYKITAVTTDGSKRISENITFKIKSQFNVFTISSVEVTNQKGEPSDLTPGEMGFIKVTTKSGKPIASLITVNLFDSELTSIGIGSIQSTLASGESEIILSFMIPLEASSGPTEIFVNALSDWPSNGGIPLTGEFTIVEELQ